MKHIVYFLYRINLLLGTLLLAAIVLLTVADVLMRYLFDRPIFGASEAIQYLLGLAVFAGMYLVTKDGGHVSVSLLDSVIRDRYPRLFLLIFRLFSLTGAGLIAGIMVWKLLDVMEYPELSVVLEIPLEYVIGSFTLLSTLVLLASANSEMRSGEIE
jgi:TRAP-type C4-dicarboxylate transport system permease small subunit